MTDLIDSFLVFTNGVYSPQASGIGGKLNLVAGTYMCNLTSHVTNGNSFYVRAFGVVSGETFTDSDSSSNVLGVEDIRTFNFIINVSTNQVVDFLVRCDATNNANPITAANTQLKIKPVY